jgi:hypothetical protein
MEFEFGEVDSVDKVPEQFRGLYVAKGDKFALNDTFKGVGESIVNLNKSLKAARQDAKNRTPTDLSPLSEYGATLDEIVTGIKNKVTDLEGKAAGSKDAKLSIENLRRDMGEAHKKELDKHTARGTALQNQLYKLLVENTATAAIIEEKGDPALLMPFLATQVKVVEEDGEFKVYVVDDKKEQRYSGINGQPMSIKELVKEMKANARYGKLFESDNDGKGGGGTKPGSFQRTPPKKEEDKSSTDKIAAGLQKRGVR